MISLFLSAMTAHGNAAALVISTFGPDVRLRIIATL